MPQHKTNRWGMGFCEKKETFPTKEKGTVRQGLPVLLQEFERTLLCSRMILKS
jgi:hypothetical protein